MQYRPRQRRQKNEKVLQKEDETIHTNRKKDNQKEHKTVQDKEDKKRYRTKENRLIENILETTKQTIVF